MTITAAWLDTGKRIAQMVCQGEWNWREHAAAQESLAELYDTSPHRADVVVVITDYYIPLGIVKDFPKISQDPMFAHPRAGAVVLVGLKPINQTQLDLFRQLFPHESRRLHASDSVDKARTLIEQLRQAESA